MPSLHPFLVHFPIALLSVAFLVEAAAVVTRQEELSRFGWWLQIVGTLMIFFTVGSGLLAEKQATFPVGSADLFQSHEQIAFLCTALFTGLLLWRVGNRGEIPLKTRWIYLVLMLVAVGAMLMGAWLGGEMVYRYGVGVGKTG
jgi:uncharacterized membrane protein